MDSEDIIRRTSAVCALAILLHLGWAAIAQSAVRAAPALISGGNPLYEVTASYRIPAGFDDGFAHEAIVLHRLACNYLANQGLQDGRFDGAEDPELQRLLAPLSVTGTGTQSTPTASGSPDVVTTGGRDGHALESTLSRQSGSLILDQLCGEPRLTPSTTIPELDHKTDFWTAFSEGWAAHFQVVAFDNSGFPDEAHEDMQCSLEALRYWNRRMEAEGARPGAASLLFPIWHSTSKWADTVDGVKSGRFVDTASACPAGMLATPGVVSSIIYALVSDPRIQSTYRDPAFYAMFAYPSSPTTEPERAGKAAAGADPTLDWLPAPRSFTPLENAYMKLFHVLASSIRPDPVISSPSPVLTLITQYAKAFPGEEEAVYDAFLWATRGATVDPAKAAGLRRACATGSPHAMLQYTGFVEMLRDSILSGEKRINCYDSPQIWLLNSGRTQGLCIYDRFGAVNAPRVFDLNTATAADLLTVPGVNPAMAAEILAARESAGGFPTIRDLAQVRTVTPEVLNQIHAMKSGMDRAMETLGPLGVKSISLTPVAVSYLTRIASRLLTTLVACSGAMVTVNMLFRTAQKRHIGAWAPPSWLDVHRSAWLHLSSAFLKVAGAAIALGVLFVLLPPLSPVLRLAGGVATGLAIWACGALPQVLGISGFAGLSTRYTILRAAWSLACLVVVAGVAFLLV